MLETAERMELKSIYEHAWMHLAFGINPYDEGNLNWLMQCYSHCFVQDFKEILDIMKDKFSLLRGTGKHAYDHVVPVYVYDDDVEYQIFSEDFDKAEIEKLLEIERLEDGKVEYAYGIVEKLFDIFDADHLIWAIKVM